MGDGTAISWTDATWSVTVGCSRVSEGCDRCYAMGQAPRQAGRGLYEGVVSGGDWTGRVNLADDGRLDQPLRWTRPRRVFVDSMSDLFHPAVPAEFIAEVWARMGLAERHTFQVLTKRPQRMYGLLSSDRFVSMWWEARERRAVQADVQRAADAGRLSLAAVWPPPNVWGGTSIESARYAFRARWVQRAPLAVRFVSAEPLLGPLAADLPDDDRGGGRAPIDWVIVGGESGFGARRMDPAWAEDLAAWCDGRGAAFHFKQLGSALAAEWGVPGKGEQLDGTGVPDWMRRREWPA